MSHVSTSLDPRGIGVLALQHKGYDKPGDGGPNWSLDLRASILATRITGRNDYEKDGLGQWILDDDSTGDINGGQLWKTRGIEHREIPQWRFATPVLTYLDGTPSAAGPGCATLTSFHIKPVWKEKYELDDRFEPIKPELFERGGKRLHPKFPVDFLGISLAADIESRQVDLFHPTDPRMVAVNRKGDALMGSLVCDMGDGFKIDPDRTARLQSFFRVVKNPTYCGTGTTTADSLYNVIAWNLGPTGCKDTRGGYVFEKRIGQASTPTGGGTPSPTGDPVITPPTRNMIQTSHFNIYQEDLINFGPGGVSSAFGTAGVGPADTAPFPSTGGFPSSTDGEGVIALMSHFDSGFTDVGDESDKHQIGRDADGHPINASHISTNAYFKRPGSGEDAPLEFGGFYIDPRRGRYILPVYLRYDPRPTHPFVCSPKKGLWRWEGECCVGSPSMPPGIQTTVTFSQPTSGIGGSFGQGPSGGGGGGGGNGGGGSLGVPRTFDFGGVRTDLDPVIRKWMPGEIQRYNATEVAIGFTAVLFRPQSLAPNSTDLRNLGNFISPKAQQQADWTTPVTARLEAFGYQNNKTWINTQKPGKGRFGGGTSNGGFALMPPEFDIFDLNDNFSRNDVTASTTYFCAVPGSYFAAGYPVPSTGGLKTAYRWGSNSSGDLIFSRINSSGTVTTVLTLTAAGAVTLPSSTNLPQTTTVSMGAGSGTATVKGKAYLSGATEGNDAGGAETVLHTYDLPADSLSASGKGVDVYCMGTFGNNPSTKDLRFEVGSVSILLESTAAVDQGWALEAKIVSTGTDTQKITFEYRRVDLAGAATINRCEIDYTTATENDGAAITIQMTGAATGANDITQEVMDINFLN